jgi:FAD:protein FMN transferase
MSDPAHEDGQPDARGTHEESDGSDTPAAAEVAPFSVRRFNIMGTFGELLLRAGDDDLAERVFDEAVDELGRLAAMLTRFEPDSAIEQLNDAGGGTVDGELREILEASLRAHHDSGGRVDVGIGADLIAAGYDRDFDDLELPSTEELSARAPAAPTPGGATREPGYELGPDGTVRIRPGVRIDLGGIAKGWCSDHVCRMLAPHGSCIVNLGGDIAVHVAEGDEPWPIGVEYGGATHSFAIAYGGLATSGQDRRVWRTGEGGELAHHVIDPRTGRSAQTDVLRITVMAESCLESEVWAKALFLQGFDAARAEANERQVTAILVAVDGRYTFTGALAWMVEDSEPWLLEPSDA